MFNSFSSRFKQSKQAYSYFSFVTDQIIKYSVKASLYSSDVHGLGDHVLNKYLSMLDSNLDMCKAIDIDLISDTSNNDGTYTMKKVLIQNIEQLELVREEIRVSSLFSHPYLLPLLGHAIISVKINENLEPSPSPLV
ncbi:hypothetical protein SO802_007782 [Lithocarpus litseifolius]|uniref:Protein kinase domain-containing protein n=1 Tax=Lithocarpus litseifolius TaxID=425828 RepID=A0AAW2DRC3_9ROSI